MAQANAAAAIQETRADIAKMAAKIDQLQKELDQHREKLEFLQEVEAYFTEKLAGTAPTGDDAPRATNGEASRSGEGQTEAVPESNGGEFAGMTTLEATLVYLGRVGPPGRDTRELIDNLRAGGWKSEAENVYTSVFGTLNRISKRSNTDLDKVDGKWCLKSWNDDPEQGRLDIE